MVARGRKRAHTGGNSARSLITRGHVGDWCGEQPWRLQVRGPTGEASVSNLLPRALKAVSERALTPMCVAMVLRMSGGIAIAVTLACVLATKLRSVLATKLGSLTVPLAKCARRCVQSVEKRSYKYFLSLATCTQGMQGEKALAKPVVSCGQEGFSDCQQRVIEEEHLPGAPAKPAKLLIHFWEKECSWEASRPGGICTCDRFCMQICSLSFLEERRGVEKTALKGFCAPN